MRSPSRSPSRDVGHRGPAADSKNCCGVRQKGNGEKEIHPLRMVFLDFCTPLLWILSFSHIPSEFGGGSFLFLLFFFGAFLAFFSPPFPSKVISGSRPHR